MLLSCWQHLWVIWSSLCFLIGHLSRITHFNHVQEQNCLEQTQYKTSNILDNFGNGYAKCCRKKCSKEFGQFSAILTSCLVNNTYLSHASQIRYLSFYGCWWIVVCRYGVIYTWGSVWYDVTNANHCQFSCMFCHIHMNIFGSNLCTNQGSEGLSVFAWPFLNTQEFERVLNMF